MTGLEDIEPLPKYIGGGIHDEDESDEESRVPLIDDLTRRAITNVMEARGITHVIMISRASYLRDGISVDQRTPDGLAGWLWAQDRPEGFQ